MSVPQNEPLVEISRVRLAAAYVEDAWAGKHDTVFKRPGWQRLYSNLKPFRNLSLLLLVVLSFVETPAWCIAHFTAILPVFFSFRHHAICAVPILPLRFLLRR